MKEYEAYENFANGIIEQAAKDYKRGYTRLRRRYGMVTNFPEKSGNDTEYKYFECRRFFFGDWYPVLSKVDPRYIVEQIESEVDTRLYQNWQKNMRMFNYGRL